MGSDKMLKPGRVPKLVGEYLVNEMKRDADWVEHLKAVCLPKGEAFQIRIFDNDEALARQVDVKDYTSLDMQRDLVLYEGTFDEKSKKVELKETINVRANQDSVPYTLPEIWKKLAGLTGTSQAVFYLRGSPATGGPFGRGAAVIERNPNWPGKKQKKYIVSLSDMEGTRLSGAKSKFFESDKSKEVASWIKERHGKRMGGY
jgi:hypothetical protein